MHNVSDMIEFIQAVRAYTGSLRFSIVAHSLGVTLARRALIDGGFRNDIDTFIGIAGANHGTSFCPPGTETIVESCDEIAMGTPWLAALNAADGEKPAPHTLTVSDGTGAGDPAYAGIYKDSPKLGGDGVLNCTYPGFYHNDLRVDPRIASQYVDYLLGPYGTCPTPPLPVPYT
jgi:hypothetical protein